MTTELDTNIYGANDIANLKLYKRKDGSERVVASGHDEMIVPPEFLTITEYAELLQSAMNGDEPMQKQVKQLKLVYLLMK